MQCPACKGQKKKCRLCLGSGEEKTEWTDLECERAGYLIALDTLSGAINLGYHLNKTNEHNVERVGKVLEKIRVSLGVKSRKKEK